MKRYVLEVVIQEGNDEFWESLKGKTGCDEIVECVVEALSDNGFGDDGSVRLISFTQRKGTNT